jgi:hypothetical protein
MHFVRGASLTDTDQENPMPVCSKSQNWVIISSSDLVRFGVDSYCLLLLIGTPV